MDARSLFHAAVFGALAALPVLTLAGCGHTAAAAPTTSTTPPTATSSAAVPVAMSTSPGPTSSSVAAPSTSRTSPSPSPTTVRPTGLCTSAQLAFTLGAHVARAGRTTAALTLRNTAAVACTVRGNPAVDIVDSYGMQAGPAAAALAGDAPDASPATVTLAHGATATASFSYVAAADGGPGCDPDTAAELLVFAPGAATSAKVPFAASICTDQADRPVITPVVAAGGG